MGRVYEAERLEAGPGPARVALKILRRERAQGDHLPRFRQEARAVSRVGHPSIVEVLDFAELPDGTVYLAMERLYGRSFERWLEAPGRLVDGLGWLAQIARGLHAAHAAGIVHRDVKPANLFLHVDPRGPPDRVQGKILDFGIAKVVTLDATHIETQAGTLLGTPYYLAPERALGRRLDARADLYSLGVVLYEVLTGLVPFEDESFMGILAQHIKAQPLDPRQAAPDRALPPGISQLTMRLLAKEPDRRPPDGAAVAAEIERLLREEAVALAGVTTGPRAVAAVGDDTVQFQDVALRPTAAPDGRAPGRSMEAAAVDGLGATLVPSAVEPGRPVASVSGPHARTGVERGGERVVDSGGSGSRRFASLPAGPMEFAGGVTPSSASRAEVVPVVAPSPRPARAMPQWPLWIAVAVVCSGITGLVGWRMGIAADASGRATSSEGPAAGSVAGPAAESAASEPGSRIEPVEQPETTPPTAEEGATPEHGPSPEPAAAAAPSAAGEAGPAAVARDESAARPMSSADAVEAPAEDPRDDVAPAAIPPATSGAKTPGTRRNPRSRRSRPAPGPAAPPPPDFKDDVF